MPFLDDDAFEAVLSFVDECVAHDALAEAAGAVGEDVGGELYGDEQEMPMQEGTQLQVARPGPELRRSCRLASKQAASSNSVILGNQTSRHSAAQKSKKKALRQAGDFGDSSHAYLHERVGQLEAELQTLRERSEAIDVPRPPTELNVYKSWEEFAAHKRREREQAEQENTRLKLILASQIKVATSFEAILLKRAQQQIAECSASIRQPVDAACPSRQTLDFRADTADFQGLLQYLDDTYRQVDAVMAANGLAWKEVTQQDVQMREGVDGMYLEVFSNKLLPFGLQTTAEATWNYFKGSKKHRGTLYAKEAQNLDTPYTIIEHFSKELVAGNSSTDVRIKQIVRRYVEPNRELVVWVASITPVDVAQKPFGGFTSRHRNYAVIKRARASTPEHELSLLQLVSHGMLDTQTGTIYDPQYVRAITDFLLNDAARNIKADQQLIEKSSCCAADEKRATISRIFGPHN